MSSDFSIIAVVGNARRERAENQFEIIVGAGKWEMGGGPRTFHDFHFHFSIQDFSVTGIATVGMMAGQKRLTLDSYFSSKCCAVQLVRGNTKKDSLFS
jgi:hypothetical protein